MSAIQISTQKIGSDEVAVLTFFMPQLSLMCRVSIATEPANNRKHTPPTNQRASLFCMNMNPKKVPIMNMMTNNIINISLLLPSLFSL